MKKPKAKKKPQDATMRNIKAAKKRDLGLEERIKGLEKSEMTIVEWMLDVHKRILALEKK